MRDAGFERDKSQHPNEVRVIVFALFKPHPSRVAANTS